MKADVYAAITLGNAGVQVGLTQLFGEDCFASPRQRTICERHAAWMEWEAEGNIDASQHCGNLAIAP
jgi:hypothetical protein